MASKSGIRNPLREYIGGPWALIAMVVISAAGLVIALARKRRRRASPPAVVPEVDLEQYAGLWHEFARTPNRFQGGCVASTATYEVIGGNRLSVVNRCHISTFDGPERSIRGKAWVPDPAHPAKLKVRFNTPFAWWFTADYWIVYLSDDYRHAVVSGPDRSRIWVLSREPRIDEEEFQDIVGRLEALGFDLTRLSRTPQPDSDLV